MNSRTIAAALLLVGAVAGSDLLACGDKFLVVSRGTRFQRAGVRTSATILVYANPASGLPKMLANLPVETTLRKAGYVPTSVATIDELDRALAGHHFDLVLTDVADTKEVGGRLHGDNSPIVLPVVYNMTGAELAKAKKQYLCILKSPAKSQSFLDAIDEALAMKPPAKAGGKTSN